MITSYLLLFSSAFLAATILPFYSEVILFALLSAGGDPFMLVVIATLGNTLGAVVNWVMGRYLLHFRDRRWFTSVAPRWKKPSAGFNITASGH
jgi:membrane protein YqaA with SNARE-associated domain